MLQTAFAKISEPNEQGVFAYEHLPTELERARTHGRLFVLLTLGKPKEETVSPLEIARNVYAAILENYYSSEEKPFEAAKSTATKIQEKFGNEIGIALACLVGEVFYTVIRGDLSAYLLREGALVQILKGEGELVSASGYPKKGDTFLIGNNRFFETYSPKIPAVFGREEFEESVDLFQKLAEIGQYCIAINFLAEEETLRIAPVEQDELPSKLPKIVTA